jgi:hypothetical protein
MWRTPEGGGQKRSDFRDISGIFRSYDHGRFLANNAQAAKKRSPLLTAAVDQVPTEKNDFTFWFVAWGDAGLALGANENMLLLAE